MPKQLRLAHLVQVGAVVRAGVVVVVIIIVVAGTAATAGRRSARDTLEVYESATDSWSAAAPMPTARYSLTAAIVGNTLFALGGAVYDGFDPLNGIPTDAAEAFDIEGGSWTAAEPMATPRMYFAAVAGP